jgi:2-amino-4-hydroxy-6-hydroxymethyldihydropteridine diphosphokinase
LEPVTAYLGLGSNLGERAANLQRALRHLAETGAVEVIRCSWVYQTAPWGYADQPAFLNCVAEVRTTLSPVDLLRRVKEIEDRMGREATFRWGPRHIDIDILLYGQEVVRLQCPDLQVPHARLHQRAFVLAPLAELGADLVHPVVQKSIASLKDQVEGMEGVVRWGPPLELPPASKPGC